MPPKAGRKASGPKVTQKRGSKQNVGDVMQDDSQSILEGINSLHTWIKTQTMIKPTKMEKKKANPEDDNGVIEDDEEDEVVISLKAKDPQAARNVVRFDYTTGEYIPVKLRETMIDHLDIQSTILHIDSDEAKRQIQQEKAFLIVGSININLRCVVNSELCLF